MTLFIWFIQDILFDVWNQICIYLMWSRIRTKNQQSMQKSIQSNNCWLLQQKDFQEWNDCVKQVQSALNSTYNKGIKGIKILSIAALTKYNIAKLLCRPNHYQTQGIEQIA